MEYEYSPTDFQQSVERGIIIVKGYTPQTLKFGFRFTECNKAGEVIIPDRTTSDSTDKKLMDKYNVLKPQWL